MMPATKIVANASSSEATGSSFNHAPRARSSRAAALLALGGLLLALAGCVRKCPAHYAPVWSPDGSKLYYAAARPDGTLAIREIDVASGRAGELAAGRFAAPPAAMALSPRGDKVACALLVREAGQPPSLRLHILSAGGQGDRVVWQGPSPEGAVDLCWTPDGAAVVVAADRPGGAGLYRVPADGSAPGAIAADLAQARAPTVSPDGRRVAFVGRADRDAPWSLYVSGLDGAARKVATPAVFTDYAVGYWPAWSPRGDAIAYVAERCLCQGFAEVLAWDTASGQSRLLARTLAGACIAPAWSPEGDALAYVCLPFGAGRQGPGTDGLPADIAVVDPRGKEPRTLVADGLANLMPAWSPDGRTLAFATCADPAAGPHALRLVAVDDAAVRPAEDTPEAQFLLAWARHQRSNGNAAGPATAAAAQIRDAPMAAFAHAHLARHYAGQKDWAPAAHHAERAAAAAGSAPGQIEALQLLAQARMRLGEPQAAAAALDRILAKGDSPQARALRQGLADGMQAVAALEAEAAKAPTAERLQALADLYLHKLGNPRKALDALLRLARDFSDGPHVSAAARSLFTCCEQLGGRVASYRVLEWAAARIPQAEFTREQALQLAQVAAANGDPRAALRWLDRLAPGPADDPLRDAASRVRLRAAELLAASHLPAEALAACRREATGQGTAAAARAALEAAKLLIAAGDHRAAADLLLDALGPRAEPPVAREALRLLAAGRLHRREPPTYDLAEVAQLVMFGCHDSAIAYGEPLLGALAPDDPRRAALRGRLALAYDALAALHLARGDALTARITVQRSLATAARGDDLPKALARLAECHKQAGDRRSLIETLSRLALDFPDRPEGAEARRQLLRLDTDAKRQAP